MTHEAAREYIRKRYMDSAREIVVPPDVFHAYESGLIANLRLEFYPRPWGPNSDESPTSPRKLAFKDAYVIKGEQA